MVAAAKAVADDAGVVCRPQSGDFREEVAVRRRHRRRQEQQRQILRRVRYHFAHGRGLRRAGLRVLILLWKVPLWGRGSRSTQMVLGELQEPFRKDGIFSGVFGGGSTSGTDCKVWSRLVGNLSILLSVQSCKVFRFASINEAAVPGGGPVSLKDWRYGCSNDVRKKRGV